MFSSREAVFSIDDVPAEWIFEHYLGLTEKLHGQSVKIKSLFNPRDNDPSMYIYLNPSSQEYKFKCFSTGTYGSAINLIMITKSLSFIEAANLIIGDYKEYLKGSTYTKTKMTEVAKWKLYDLKYRSWNTDDKEYWAPYNIGSPLLNLYNVRPIESFTMTKESESFSRSGRRVYAYTKADGEVYKIYMPENKDKKFMNFSKYIQGWEQLEGNSRLFICSSLKDIMAMKSLGIKGDYIAPSSENSRIKPILDWIEEEYSEKYVIFDNDEAGIRMMETYKKEYDLPYLILDLSKDISDSIKDHGAKKVKECFKKLIKL
jgi:hypothetical protein